ncbi:MAG: hypothetical protein CMN37_06120 [SAR116 cluster bacterium]|nr:hypothetical protein [SAR116 cluster bacterium]
MKSLNFKNISKKYKHLNFFTIIVFLSSCSSNNLDNRIIGARFIDINSNFINYEDKINLSTSYLDNNNLICIYIKNDTKIIKEVSENENCPPEI